jgi:phage-related protein
MSSLITSLKDLLTAIFEVIFSTFRSAFDTVYGILHALINFFIDIPKMLLHTVKGTLEAAGGVGKFVASELLYCFSDWTMMN